MHEKPGDPGGEACGCRSIDTEEFERTISEVTGRDVTRILDVYLREPTLPVLEVAPTSDGLELRWSVADGGVFELPIDVSVDGVPERVPMTGGAGRIAVPPDARVEIDPDAWILMEWANR